MSFDFQVNLSVSMKRKPESLKNIELKAKREDHPQRVFPVSLHQNVTSQLCHEHTTSHKRHPGKLLECAQRRSSPDPLSRDGQTHLAMQSVYELIHRNCPLSFANS